MLNHGKLAKLVLELCNNNKAEATTAWNRLMENNCTQSQFAILLSKDEEYAETAWMIEDIKARKPKWSSERCKEFLTSNEGHIKDWVIEQGNNFIDTLLDSENDE